MSNRYWLRKFIVISLISLFSASLSGAGEASRNWPQWRGPNLDGTAASSGSLPVRWSATENVVWRAELPSWSAATPIIWEDTIFVTSAQEGFTDPKGRGLVGAVLNRIASAMNFDDELLLIALDRKDGSIRWRRVIGAGNKILFKQNMASPSPVTDGKHVWIMTGVGVLTCFDFSGKQIWQRDIEQDYGEFGLNWGYASSPLLHEGRLYIQVLHGMKTDEPSYLFALEGSSGETIWKVDRPTDAPRESPDAYSTPMLAAVEDTLQLIITGGDYLTGHDLETGKELWRGGGLNPAKAANYRTIASALVVGDVIFAPGRRKPLIAFRSGGSGDVTSSHRLWSTDYGPDVPTPTSDGERVYIVDDKGIALCLRVENGTVVWDRSRLDPGTYSASPLLADGKIYATNEDGTTTVFAAGDKFKILSVNKLDQYTLSSPAVAGDQIFIRAGNYLYCLAKKSTRGD